MKNLSLIINAVLIIAVAFLFYNEFTESDSLQKSASKTTTQSEFDIAYVNSDTLLNNYKYYEEVSKTLEEKSNKLQQEYARRAEGLQRQFADYQKTMTNMTVAQARAVEEDLGQKRQNLIQYQESINQQLYQEQAKITQELYARVAKFLKTYSEEHNLKIVLTYTPGSGVWYANESLDITHYVIEGLNKEHDAGGPNLSDSTSTQ